MNQRAARILEGILRHFRHCTQETGPKFLNIGNPCPKLKVDDQVRALVSRMGL